ncbi:MAG TPA: formate dehydrogenase accessory sulfurtransferase FdhD [Oxalicibacterium sp.]|uniref:formate dehydrogenase accessory sulfurtransferase FdhD n=1 Tax=Oxalicibacterium sp. TaxID=2766525 RepID=UPI002B8CFE79|nr:formate dehydrogenase accessory sulfurtransferase FdhD [Oxalicibacterium sp.]HWU99321.1 formate dehydrogenase accessory sulfurtransferase FdhD [Oxalicibacterium sp.]
MNAFTDEERSALVRVPVEKWDADRRVVCEDDVAEEIPVALEYNGISHAVMMTSPYDLEDFALGFSLSEGILQDRSELYDCEVIPGCDGIQVQMQVATERFVALKDKRRNLTGRTGCGLCGAETLEQAIRRPEATIGTAMFSAAQIHAGMKTMRNMQRLQKYTGATHAAAWMTVEGSIDLVREDVGRHNALDKLIGAMAAKRLDFSAGAALITSRASYEMVQKSATMGIGFLAAISAPTSLAIRMAEESNVTLIGFVRDQSHVVYAQSHRLIRATSK